MADQPKQILVVEDDGELRESLVDSLQISGYRALGAGNAREAKAKLKVQKFDCILFDVVLGEERCEPLIWAVREDSSLNRETPILVISGNLDANVVATIRGHIQGALVKPFDQSTMVEAVKRILR